MWIIIHVVSRDSFLSQFAQLLQNICIRTNLPAQNLEKDALALLFIEAITNLLNEFIDSESPRWHLSITQVFIFETLIKVGLYLVFIINEQVVYEV